MNGENLELISIYKIEVEAELNTPTDTLHNAYFPTL